MDAAIITNSNGFCQDLDDAARESQILSARDEDQSSKETESELCARFVFKISVFCGAVMGAIFWDVSGYTMAPLAIQVNMRHQVLKLTMDTCLG